MFQRLTSAVRGLGNCYAASALVMLSLYNVRSAYLVRGDKRGSRGIFLHSWVEVKIGNIEVVIDPLQCALNPLEKTLYYRTFNYESTFRCPSGQFWQYPISRQFRERLLDHNSSYLFYELYNAYVSDGSRYHGFTPRVLEQLRPEAGKKFLAFRSNRAEFVTSQFLVDTLMQNPALANIKRDTDLYDYSLPENWH